MELMVAMALLTTLLVVCVQLSARATDCQRALGRRQAATSEAANVMERLSARSWDELADKNLAEFPLSEAARQSVPGARLEIRVVEPAGQEGAKRIGVAVRWPEGESRPESSVRLTAWRYRAAKEASP
jgi:hypothetical protein